MTGTNFIIREIGENIYYLEYPDRISMGLALMRFSEHYDSAHFKGRVFSHAELRDWYVANSKKGMQTGEFTYCEDWEGFNFPSSALGLFYDGSFGDLNVGEQELMEVFADKYGAGREFYIIATSSDQFTREILLHELAHALFYIDVGYRGQVLSFLNRMDKSSLDIMNDFVKNMHGVGYADERVVDEIHAYLVNYDDLLAEGIDTPALREAHKALRLILEVSLMAGARYNIVRGQFG